MMIFNSSMKSELLKRSYKRMYKEDIINLKEALIVIMPALDAASEFEEEARSPKQEEAPSCDSHFCKNTHRLVKRFKQQYELEPTDGVVNRATWDLIMRK